MTAFEKIKDGLEEALAIAQEPSRFCGRCQKWLPDVIELHVCVRAPRLVGYAWYEPDEFAFEKNSISDARPFKCGELIAEFHASVGSCIRMKV